MSIVLCTLNHHYSGKKIDGNWDRFVCCAIKLSKCRRKCTVLYNIVQFLNGENITQSNTLMNPYHTNLNAIG